MDNRLLLLPIIGVATFFILLFSFTKLFGPIPFSVSSITTVKQDTFQVTGEGKVTAPPDIASIIVGVSASGSTVKAAQDQLNTNINKVSEAVKKLRVEEKDIQTTNYNINPNYDFREADQRITGYSASTNLAIKVRILDQANSVIDAATASGANQVGGISFGVSDEPVGSQTLSTKTKLENEAREKAVADARSKAENAAKIAGFKLGRIINYSEGFGGVIPMPYRALSAEKMDAAAPTQVEPGSSEIVVNVTLSFEIN